MAIRAPDGANNDYYNTMTMMMTMTLCGGGCGEAEDMRDAFEVSSISSNSDQNTALKLRNDPLLKNNKTNSTKCI